MRAGPARTWLAAWLLLLGAVWLAATGPTVLSGWSLETLEALAQGRGLVPTEFGPTPPETGVLRALGGLPGDPTALYSWSVSAISLLACSIALVGLSYGFKSTAAGTLAAFYLYLGPPAWLWTTSISGGLVRTALLLGLVCLLRGRPGLTVLPLLVCAPWDPGTSLTLLALGIAGSLWRWHRERGSGEGFVALLAAAMVALPWLFRPGSEPLALGWSDYSAATLAALVGFALMYRRSRAERGLLLLVAVLFTLPLFTGEAELATPILLGLAAANWARWGEGSDLEPGASAPADNGALVSIPWRVLGGALSILLLTALSWSAARSLETAVLRPATEARVPYSALLRPAAWRSHLAAQAEEPWRRGLPRPEVSPDFAEALTTLSESLTPTFCLLTPEAPHEDRTLSLLAALATEKRLVGWLQGRTLSSPLKACRQLGRNLLLDGPDLLVGRSVGPEGPEGPLEWAIAPPPTAPEDSADPDRYSPIPLGQLVAAGGLRQSFPPRNDPGALRGYRWVDTRESHTVFFGSHDGELELPTAPGAYRVVCLSAPESAVRQFSLFPPALTLLNDQTEFKAVRGELLSLPMELENPGPGVLYLGRFSRLLVDAPSGDGPAAGPDSPRREASAARIGQALEWPGVLYHRERLQVTVRFRAPERPGFHPLQVHLDSRDGRDGETLQVEVDPPLRVYVR